jgi:CHAT domain-containing protein
VQTAVGSLWYVSDEGTLGLMSEFYQQLKTAGIKGAALRQAQIAMLRGEVRLEGGRLRVRVGVRGWSCRLRCKGLRFKLSLLIIGRLLDDWHPWVGDWNIGRVRPIFSHTSILYLCKCD